ncbi:MAG: hypothetical protein ACTSXU_14240 [Promethearchaeota archaeon]
MAVIIVESKDSRYELKIDKSKQYKVNAGQCDKCGQYKTWEFRIVNERTGKKMPAHVTEDGYLINDGECPYWSNIKKQFKARRQNKEIESKSNENPNVIQAPRINTQKQAINSDRSVGLGEIVMKKVDESIIIQLKSRPDVKIELTEKEALMLVRDMLDSMISS